MDVEISNITSGKSLPDPDDVYRKTPIDWKEKKDKFTPSLRGFTLSEADKQEGYGLSVDWSAGTTPEESIARVGASYKTGTQKFKEYKNWDLYALNIGFLKSLESIIDVIYDPFISEIPIKGKPNNISHSLVNFNKHELEKNEAEVYVKIRSHATDRKIQINMTKVGQLVELYRNL